jgi:hypothetical protein
MFWAIGITESYINSLILEDITSSRNFYDLLDTLKNNQNIAIADDINFKNIKILNEKIKNEKLSPSYQTEITNLFTELMKQSLIEKNEESKKKFIRLELENNDDLEFCEDISNKNLLDAILVDKKDIYFQDYKNKYFEIIENDPETGILLSNLFKDIKNYSSKGIPKRDKSNIQELGKIILTSKQLNFIAYNFLDKIIDFYQRFEEGQLNRSNSPMIGTVYLLLNLISESKKRYNNSDLNIYTPMTKNRDYRDLSMIKDILQKIFDTENSDNNNAMKGLIDAGCSFNIYIFSRVNMREASSLHTRGLFTEFCNIGTEWDELCWHTGSKVTKVNADLNLTYNPNMRVNDILEMKNNPDISTKIKIF